jgi:hypothetical protein
VKPPRYPVYVPTKGRADSALTIRMLMRDRVPFRVVVEHDELDAYAAVCGRDALLELPASGRGLIFARNWIKAHATSEGHARHWQLDDNIGNTYRVYRGRRIRCDTSVALRVCEDFCDRYTNVALAGLAYSMFGFAWEPPVRRNVHVYSCTLVNNAIPHSWRLPYNDDTDLCLQVLADDWCTVLVQAFVVEKKRTMTVKGGNTDDLYQGDGRLVMARSLERMWPGVVKTTREYGRPQHAVNWRKFTTPLQLRDDIDLAQLPKTDEYGLELVAKQPIRSKRLQTLHDDYTSAA